MPSWPPATTTVTSTRAHSSTMAGNAPYPYSAVPPPTAYIPVEVRSGFGSYSPNASSQAPVAAATPTFQQHTQEQPKTGFPDSVRSYVQRTFLERNDDPTIKRQELELKLKDIISGAKESGQLWAIDWDNMPLPQALIRSERESQLRGQLRDFSARVLVPKPAVPSHISPSGAMVSKKRKSSDLADDGQDGRTPPWRSTNNARGSLEERVSHPADKRPTMDEALSKSSKSQKEKRLRRFDGGYKSTYRSPSPPPSTGPVVGTNQNLEKRYLRLTAPPVPSQVRPEYILRQTLDLLKSKWRKESNYSYICDQFKSMRQDLTVQRIKNDFTVSVYEIHARIALEKGDLGEYNQCQTQLKSLYQLGLNGNSVEFKAYRILYFIHTANRTGLNEALADLTAAEKATPPVKHALEVRSALALGNYHKFFQLYLDTPNMGAYLMDMFVVRERLGAMCRICRAYKPDVKLRFVTEELGFESDTDAAQFIMDYNGQHLLEDRSDCIVFLTGKAGNLFESSKTEAFRKVDIKGQI